MPACTVPTGSPTRRLQLPGKHFAQAEGEFFSLLVTAKAHSHERRHPWLCHHLTTHQSLTNHQLTNHQVNAYQLTARHPISPAHGSGVAFNLVTPPTQHAEPGQCDNLWNQGPRAGEQHQGESQMGLQEDRNMEINATPSKESDFILHISIFFATLACLAQWNN